MMPSIFTIGHSSHGYDRFVTLLRKAGITAVADVRTSPWSRHLPHFNRHALKGRLHDDGIAYAFLGQELGGRPSDRRFYCDGVADYERMATAVHFKQGIDRVMEGAREYRIALMCAERDPLDCHRCLLVGRALSERGMGVRHILADNSISSHAELEDRLLALSGQHGSDLFATHQERLAAAYRERGRKVAFAAPMSALFGAADEGHDRRGSQ